MELYCSMVRNPQAKRHTFNVQKVLNKNYDYKSIYR